MNEFDELIQKINETIGDASVWLIAQILNHPYILVVSAVAVIYLVNHMIQKRFQSELLEFHYLIFFILSMYLTYLLFKGGEFIDPLNQFSIDFIEACKTGYGEWCNHIPNGFTKENLAFLAYILFLISINSRLMWIVSIVIFEFYIVTEKSDNFYQLFSSIPENKEYLFKGTIPFILVAPVVLVLWIFRENDRYTDILNKNNELKLKEKELSLREKELKLKYPGSFESEPKGSPIER